MAAICSPRPISEALEHFNFASFMISSMSCGLIVERKLSKLGIFIRSPPFSAAILPRRRGKGKAGGHGINEAREEGANVDKSRVNAILDQQMELLAEQSKQCSDIPELCQITHATVELVRLVADIGMANLSHASNFNPIDVMKTSVWEAMNQSRKEEKP